VHDRLDELAAEHGAHVTDQWSIRLDQHKMAQVMARVRDGPPHLITDVDDLLTTRRLPPTDALVLHLGAQARMTLRPSGTEPKLKLYFEAVEPVSNNDVAAARRRAAATIRALQQIIKPSIQ
jgi:phosphomannomutase